MTAAQLDLLDYAPPSQRHSATSREAAEAIQSRANGMRQRVLAYLQQHSEGATDEQLATALAMNPSTLRPRRIELVESGMVSNSNRTAKTRSGRNAVVWVAAEGE